jgi:ribosomal subunit interface protein
MTERRDVVVRTDEETAQATDQEDPSMPDGDELDLTIATQGEVSEQAKEHARTKLARLVGYTRDPILWAQARLSLEGNPARERPAVVEVIIDVNGTPVRAHVAARDLDEAIDLVYERLTRRLKRHEELVHRSGQDRRWTGVADGHEWRRGDLPTQRPEWYDRPLDERQLVRKKTFALEPMTVDEAAFDLDMLGHDFYLFTELTTEVDAVIAYDLDDHGLELQLPEGATGDPEGRAAAPVRRTPPAPRLTIDEAVERLDAGGERFVFFVNADLERGNVVYHRYDGHYGVITPA